MLPRRFLPLILFLCARVAVAQPVANPDPERFRSEIDAFTAWDSKNSAPEGAILFVGSSSIRLWATAEAFPGRRVINRGFGGAHCSDVLSFYDRVVTPFAPEAIVLYCGDNDVADGKPAGQVLADFDRFLGLVRARYGMVPVIWVEIKPSVARWGLWETMHAVNEGVAARRANDPMLRIARISEPMLVTGTPPASSLFADDGLHLSPAGYALWTDVVREELARAIGY
jgi:lysophospholipase L1-like esterase